MELGSRADALQDREQPAILTPHIGEMAAMLECDAAAMEADRVAAVVAAARRFTYSCTG